jgi:hypothetical protein
MPTSSACCRSTCSFIRQQPQKKGVLKCELCEPGLNQSSQLREIGSIENSYGSLPFDSSKTGWSEWRMAVNVQIGPSMYICENRSLETRALNPGKFHIATRGSLSVRQWSTKLRTIMPGCPTGSSDDDRGASIARFFRLPDRHQIPIA